MPTAWLIEDSDTAAHLATMHLTAMGYEVVRFVSVFRALTEAMRHPSPTVDVLITDVCLPGRWDGIEGVPIIREALGRPSLPVVVMSAIFGLGSPASRRARSLGVPIVEKGAGVRDRLRHAILEATEATFSTAQEGKHDVRGFAAAG